VVRGSATVVSTLGELRLAEGAYFCVPGAFRLDAQGVTAVFRRVGFRGLFAAGMIEEKGRLAYIDGCSDTLLVYPPRLGDPVLNHLHFPSSIDQTMHAHPSIRLGVVARGSGLARGPGWERRLAAGDLFLLEAHEQHAFRTTETTMDIIAYHPDSDWGPTDAAHPMKNRTYLVER
jgi:quercetin dioxygenase-like cupin family protein